jgi:hypothetical protein
LPWNHLSCSGGGSAVPNPLAASRTNDAPRVSTDVTALSSDHQCTSDNQGRAGRSDVGDRAARRSGARAATAPIGRAARQRRPVASPDLSLPSAGLINTGACRCGVRAFCALGVTVRPRSLGERRVHGVRSGSWVVGTGGVVFSRGRRARGAGRGRRWRGRPRVRGRAGAARRGGRDGRSGRAGRTAGAGAVWVPTAAQGAR